MYFSLQEFIIAYVALGGFFFNNNYTHTSYVICKPTSYKTGNSCTWKRSKRIQIENNFPPLRTPSPLPRVTTTFRYVLPEILQTSKVTTNTVFKNVYSIFFSFIRSHRCHYKFFSNIFLSKIFHLIAVKLY